MLRCVASFAAAMLFLASASAQDLGPNARLLAAARAGDHAAVVRALGEGAAVDSRNRLGETALVVALKRERPDIARALIEAGADVNLAALNGVTPLMAAAFGGHVDIAKLLLDRGARVDALDRLRKNAMTYAAGEGRTNVVALLLSRGVDPNAVYANDLTALMWAAGFGRAATVKALLDAGARADLRDDRGKSALDMAREQNHQETARLLATVR
jgi:uncharacterized protein